MRDHSLCWLALLGGGALLGCSAPTAGPTPIDCGRGALVEHEGRSYCVYVGEGIEGYECPEGFDARLEVTGAIVCAIDAPPDDVCRDLGLGCPPPSVCPSGSDFDGHQREIVIAPDGRTSTVSEPFVLQHQETWSRSGDTMFFEGDHLWWPRTQDQCPGMSPEGRVTWWGVKTTSIVLDADGFPSETQTTCVPSTYPGANLEVRRSGGTTVGCWLGHHPHFGVHCGPMGHGWLTPTFVNEEMQNQRIAAADVGFLVFAFRRDPAEAWLQALSLAGEPVGAARATEPIPDLLEIARVGDEWWFIAAAVVPVPTLRITPFGDDLVAREPFELLLPHRTAQTIRIRALRAGAASELHAIIGTAAPEEPAQLAYFLIRPDHTFASRLVQRNEGEDDVVGDLRPSGDGLSVIATSSSAATGESIVRYLRLDCDGRLLEPPLELLRGAAVSHRAIETSGDTTWAITSQGASDPGAQNVLRTIRTE